MLLAALALPTCTPHARSPRPELGTGGHSTPRRTVIVVAIDGVRWQDVFEGVDPALADRFHVPQAERVDSAHLVPNLYRLMTEEGAAVGAPGAGRPIEASGPNFVSLPGYMEMLSGRADTGCTSNDCARVPFATVADDVAASGMGVATVVTSWAEIGRAATAFRSGVVASVGRHGGIGRETLEAEPGVAPFLAAGAAAAPEPGEDDFRPDAMTAAVALSVLGAVKPAFLFVGLGETDEYGHHGDYRRYLDALHRADATVGRLAEQVRHLNAEGNPATLLVTTDHGRARGFMNHGRDYPESARVWLVATGARIEARGWVFSDRTRHLRDVSQTIRSVIGLSPLDTSDSGAVLTELQRPSRTVLASAP
jgi:hypothetical protein